MNSIRSIMDAKAIVGLPGPWRMRTRDAYDRAQAVTKEKLVAARRANDDELAKLLSAVKAYFKHYWGAGRICPDCGDYKSPEAARCATCRHGFVRGYRPANRLFAK